jgi:FkbM family methyltransferase
MGAELMHLPHQFLTNLAELKAAHAAGDSVPPIELQNGFTIHHRQSDHALMAFREIFVSRSYIDPTFYRPLLNDAVLDCGANIGMFALYISFLAPGIKVNCFEPCTDTLSWLLRNIVTNHLSGCISAFPFAIWDSDTSQTLNVTTDSMCTSLLAPPPREVVAKQSVACVTLSRALAIAKMSHVDLVKVDVEGAEVEVLKGACDLDWRRIDRVVVEYHESIRPGSCLNVIALLARYGFRYITAKSCGPRNGIVRAWKS